MDKQKEFDLMCSKCIMEYFTGYLKYKNKVVNEPNDVLGTLESLIESTHLCVLESIEMVLKDDCPIEYLLGQFEIQTIMFDKYINIVDDENEYVEMIEHYKNTNGR